MRSQITRFLAERTQTTFNIPPKPAGTGLGHVQRGRDRNGGIGYEA